MKIHRDIEQGSGAWMDLRCGKPTASCFSKVITPAKGEYSKQADEYENRVIAEIITGNPIDDFGGNKWTERGKEYEPEALAGYKLHTGLSCDIVTFCENDEGTFGCSPDALVIDDRSSSIIGDGGRHLGGLELKCPAPQTQIGYLLGGILPLEYKWQVYGSLLVTGLPWWDFRSYHPDLPPFDIRVNRSEILGDLENLDSALKTFWHNVNTKMEKIRGF